VGYDESTRKYSQHILIWSIGNHADVIKAVEEVSKAQRSYPPEKIRRCGKRECKNGVYFPIVWSDDGGEAAWIPDMTVYTDGDNEDDVASAMLMHEMTVTAKFTPLSKVLVPFLRLCEF
jgi:hypothetical protein